MRETFNTHAYLTICNSLSLEIELSNCGNAIRSKFYDDEKVTRWQEIKYTNIGKAYFIRNNKRYYLEQFMRVNF